MKRTYYAAWYGPRFSDGNVCISLVPGEAERIAEESAAFDRNDNAEYCGNEPNGPCRELGCPYCDIVCSIETVHSVRELFSAQELQRSKRDLLDGKVIVLYK